jgi:hypothetical protein
LVKDPGPSPWFEVDVLGREPFAKMVAPHVERLHDAHRRDRVPQQLLLVGPPGLGRELVACELAAMLTCPAEGEPWCDCSSCTRARRGTHPDVERVATLPSKSQIIVDQIRKRVVEVVSGRPFEGVRRVWVLDGVEAGRLGREAANAFLKTLEEPPVHAAFILLAGNPESVLPTVRSRCQTMVLPGPVTIAGWVGAVDVPPELAPAGVVDDGITEIAARVRSVLGEGPGGGLRRLLHLAQGVGKGRRPFEVVACVALELAASSDDGEAAEDLVRLAAEVLAAEARCRALRLDEGRQLLSCLLRWHSGLLGT